MRPFPCALILVALLAPSLRADQAAGDRPNVIIITADDMNWDSVGCYGCPLPEVTPSIDRLAEQGIRFEHAHVASTACYPSRSAISTGRRGHRSGGEGFFYLRFPNVPTVQQILHDAGYRVGILGKVKHSTPYEDTPWDVATEMGRNTDEFEREVADFIDGSLSATKPFYLVVNSHDPHRPYFKIDRESSDGDGEVPSRIYRPEEIPVHPTIPDHPDVRHEQACYFSSVRRCDDVVGRIVDVIEERQLATDTMIVFLSDHGMAVPSAKSNCYVQSTRTPFIVRWDGHIEAGQIDKDHMISSMDILPTILEAAGLENPGGMDGRSLMPLLAGGSQPDRDHIFTQYYMKIGQPNYQMRGLQDTESMYVFNPWHNGKPVYNSSAMGGVSFRTMLMLGQSDSAWARRAEYLLTRVPEEFFDLRDDPHCLNNLINDPRHAKKIDAFRRRMASHLTQSSDPMSEVFTVYQKTQSVDQMSKTYAAMWDKHDLPGRIAKNPVDLNRWTSARSKRESQPDKRQQTITDEERRLKRKASREARRDK